MLLGEYTHNLDEKKRLTLPKKFKTELGKKVVLTRGLDDCLFLFPKKEWEETVSKLRKLSFTQADTRGFTRFIYSGATEMEIDKSGRILIPDNLKNFAGLKSKVVLAGLSDKVEIWDEKRWEKYITRVEKQGDQLAEKLGEIGVL